VTVNYATADLTASAANGDYTPTSGTLTWAPATRRRTGLAQGLQSSLDSQLQAALAYFNAGDTADGVSQLGAFLNHVSAQSGKQIDATLANILIASARRIIHAVG
jgi:hypothetical protein